MNHRDKSQPNKKRKLDHNAASQHDRSPTADSNVFLTRTPLATVPKSGVASTPSRAHDVRERLPPSSYSHSLSRRSTASEHRRNQFQTPRRVPLADLLLPNESRRSPAAVSTPGLVMNTGVSSTALQSPTCVDTLKTPSLAVSDPKATNRINTGGPQPLETPKKVDSLASSTTTLSQRSSGPGCDVQAKVNCSDARASKHPLGDDRTSSPLSSVSSHSATSGHNVLYALHTTPQYASSMATAREPVMKQRSPPVTRSVPRTPVSSNRSQQQDQAITTYGLSSISLIPPGGTTPAPSTKPMSLKDRRAMHSTPALVRFLLQSH